MTYSPTRSAGRSCSSAGQRRPLRPRPSGRTIPPGRRAETPAAADDAGVARLGFAAAAAAAAEGEEEVEEEDDAWMNYHDWRV